MVRTRILIFVLGSSIVVAMIPTTVAQTWTVSGSSLCFNYGQMSQCSGSGTIQQIVSQPLQFEQQYAAGYAAGQAVGGLFQSIAESWAQHRARVNAERADVRSQLQTYTDATVALMRDDIQINTETLRLYQDLRQLNPAQSSIYDEGAAISRKILEVEEQAIDQTPKNVAIIKKAKDLKFLRENAEVHKKLYTLAYDSVTRNYVWEQLLIATKMTMTAKSESIEGQGLLVVRPENAEQTIEEAASRGNKSAQAALAQMYLSGRGKPQNYALAAEWLSAAADQGDGDSQLALGDLYEKGRGVAQNFVTAHMWYNLAAAVGVARADSYRDSIASRMTPQQIAEAQKLAAAWKPKSEKTQ